MKKLFGLLVGVFALFGAKICLGASEQILEWNATNTGDLMAWIGQTWTDFQTPILIVVGIGLGFIILRKVIGIVKAGAR